MQLPVTPQEGGYTLTYLGYKSGPLSDPIIVGNPNLGRMSSSNFFVTTCAILYLVGEGLCPP